MNVSTLILTLNEEINLPRCLAGLDWCDDIVVLDSLSSDRTVEIARAAGTRVVQRAFTTFADQRNFALDSIGFRHDWVLHLDADEVVTPELRDEIAALDPAAPADAYHIAGRLMLGESWLRYCGMFPAYQVRLAPAKGFHFQQVGHGQREQDGTRAALLKSSYLHYAFSKGLDDWYERHRRYAVAEAEDAVRVVVPLRNFLARDPVTRRRVLKAWSYKLPLRPLLRFVYVFVLRRGFIDGAAGLRYARMLASYERMIDREIAQLRTGPRKHAFPPI